MTIKHLARSLTMALTVVLFSGSFSTADAQTSPPGTQGCNPNTTGSNDTCYGVEAGASNTSGRGNSFFGAAAGSANTTGNFNSYFGVGAGQASTGSNNAFFGANAGGSAVGSDNAFFGSAAGIRNTTGTGNVFIGHRAGDDNTSENNNTFIGSSADGGIGITNATAIGANASVGRSNSLVLGSISGVNGATASTNVGVGTAGPRARLHVEGGDVYVGTQNNGIILRATDGTSCFRVTVNSAGALKAVKVTCP